MKRCVRCGQDRPTGSYSRSANTRDGLASWCLPCYGDYKKMRRLDPVKLEKERASGRLSAAKRTAGYSIPELIARRRTNRTATAKRRTTGTGRSVARASARAWAKTHPDERAELASRRRARERNARVGVVSYAAVRAENDGRCHVCLFAMGQDRGHVDHVVPLDRGGAHAMDNLLLAHADCNQRKWTHLMEELDLVAIRTGAWLLLAGEVAA